MKSSLLVCMTFAVIKNLHATPQTSFLDSFVVPFRQLRTTIQNVFLNEERRPYYQRSLTNNGKLQDIVGNNVPFPCSLNNTKSKQTPESVDKLRPGDIKVIGAIGDSLTAGFGITSTNVLNVVVENRGLSFTAGGQGTWREHLTLPNILKVFNPDLIGFSLRASLSIERASQFNVAEGGAISANTPYMAKVLVKRIKNDPRVNLEKDWKMINIFIGANDFCSEMCYINPPERVLELHEEDMTKVLRTLRDNLPRTFVNLISPPDVEALANAKGVPIECRPIISVSCPCLIGLVYQKFRRRFADIIKKWQELDMKIASYPEFSRQDFQVWQIYCGTTCYNQSIKRNAAPMKRSYSQNLTVPVKGLHFCLLQAIVFRTVIHIFTSIILFFISQECNQILALKTSFVIGQFRPATTDKTCF